MLLVVSMLVMSLLAAPEAREVAKGVPGALVPPSSAAWEGSSSGGLVAPGRNDIPQGNEPLGGWVGKGPVNEALVQVMGKLHLNPGEKVFVNYEVDYIETEEYVQIENGTEGIEWNEEENRQVNEENEIEKEENELEKEENEENKQEKEENEENEIEKEENEENKQEKEENEIEKEENEDKEEKQENQRMEKNEFDVQVNEEAVQVWGGSHLADKEEKVFIYYREEYIETEEYLDVEFIEIDEENEQEKEENEIEKEENEDKVEKQENQTEKNEFDNVQVNEEAVQVWGGSHLADEEEKVFIYYREEYIETEEYLDVEFIEIDEENEQEKEQENEQETEEIEKEEIETETEKETEETETEKERETETEKETEERETEKETETEKEAKTEKEETETETEKEKEIETEEKEEKNDERKVSIGMDNRHGEYGATGDSSTNELNTEPKAQDHHLSLAAFIAASADGDERPGPLQVVQVKRKVSLLQQMVHLSGEVTYLPPCTTKEEIVWQASTPVTRQEGGRIVPTGHTLIKTDPLFGDEVMRVFGGALPLPQQTPDTRPADESSTKERKASSQRRDEL